jgi:predicted small lipoprotein YifL
MRRSLVPFSLCAVLSLVFAGCGASGSTPSTPAASAPEADETARTAKPAADQPSFGAEYGGMNE